MARGIAVTPERLREISVRISNGAADVRAILSRLAGAVEPVGTEWVGSAQIQFEAHWDQLQRDANGLQSVLTSIATFAENAASAYEGTEKSIARTFDEFRTEFERLSDLLAPVRQGAPAPAVSSESMANDVEAETDTKLIDGGLAQDDPAGVAGRSKARSRDAARVPWARFMTPTAWREIEAGRN
jgi:WXG100 family type VII secretion target